MEKQITIEQYSEACANVAGKLVAGVFRVVWAVLAGVCKGLCLFPVFKGLKKAIEAELNSK